MSDQRSLGSARGPGGTSVGQRLRRVALAFLALAPAAGFGQESPRAQPLQVVTTLPILKEVTEAIGGALVQVESLADPRQNPHVVEPRPTLMQRARRADVYVEVGLQLEPWATRVVSGSGNAAIQIGQPGHIVSSRGITTLEVPSLLTREEGSIHPYGNPYVWLDPLNLKRMAENIAQGLIRIDAAHRGDYERGLASFSRRIDEALFGGELVESVGGAKLDRLARQGRLQEFLAERDLVAGGWLALAAPLAGVQVVSYHKTWIYFCTRFGFQVPIEIEEKPGIPPSARHRERVLEVMRERKIRTILIEGYQDRRTADWLARQSRARVLAVPIDVGPEVRVSDYFALIDLLLKQLVDAEREG